MSSASVSAWLDKYFHVARVTQLGVSFLILSKDSIVLLFNYFIWYWFKVGRQFVVTTLVEQNVISFSNISVLCRLLALCILFLSKFPPLISFAKKLPMGLGDSFTWNGYSWKFF